LIKTLTWRLNATGTPKESVELAPLRVRRISESSGILTFQEYEVEFSPRFICMRR
jgi:hypothetical protein